MFLVQLGKASTMEHMIIRNFLLSLSDTTFFVFFFFTTLLYWFLRTIGRKFHEHFYNGMNEMKLSNLTFLSKGMASLSFIIMLKEESDILKINF